MINSLTIRNFKSIVDLTLTCKKLNIFIGEPNSGKSNILEAFALQSQNSFKDKLNDEIFRYNTISDLFYDFNINNPIELITDNKKTILKYVVREDGTPENEFLYLLDSEKDSEHSYRFKHDGTITRHGVNSPTDVRYYEFKRISRFLQGYLPHLSVPYGDNLPSLLLSNKSLKEWVRDFLKSKGLMLNIKPHENEINVSKVVDDISYSYPYFSLSETLQRIIFYSIAIKSNKNSVILFDEPESNTFPVYTKSLAERIAQDESNQFFISTHNPYMLLSLIEKTSEKDLTVSLTYMKNYQTSISELNPKQISGILEYESDVFFNFEKILSL